MIRKLTLGFLLFASVAGYTQENLNFNQQKEIVSPQINADKTVTFRLMAPNATKVELQGDLLEKGTAPMVKQTDGVWTFTTTPLASELYSYSFIVDGLKIRDANNVYQIRDVASVVNVLIVGAGKADNYLVANIPHGTVAKRWYNSPGNNGKQRRLTVYTPPGYESSQQKYPVLYLLHGMGGDEEAWSALGRTAQILDNLIAQGKAKPMIVIMPNGNVSQQAAPGEDAKGLYKPTMQLPNTMDGKMEETFTDIIKFVESNYRVNATANQRAIAGLSMGGFHSLHTSRFYPKTFDYVGLFSPAIMPFGKTTSPVYENFDATLKNQFNNGLKLYWIAIGKTDFLYKNVADYRKKLDGLGVKYTYVESEGGHTWANWRDYLMLFAPQLFK